MFGHLGRFVSRQLGDSTACVLDTIVFRQFLFKKGRSVTPAILLGVRYLYVTLSTGFASPPLFFERPARLYKVVPHTCQSGMINHCNYFCNFLFAFLVLILIYLKHRNLILFSRLLTWFSYYTSTILLCSLTTIWFQDKAPNKLLLLFKMENTMIDFKSPRLMQLKRLLFLS